MKRGDIKAFIHAIREHDQTTVESMLREIPDLVSATAKSPPKKDDGQSPLQIAFKTGNFLAADLLLRAGANPNFIEDSQLNEWRAPVLHDAIRAALYNCHTLERNVDRFEKAKAMLDALLAKGADPNAVDTYGNCGGNRAVLDARSMITNPKADLASGIVLEQIRSIFALLAKYGADFHRKSETRSSVVDSLRTFKLDQHNLLPKGQGR
jgi:ankyrin repeat protein